MNGVKFAGLRYRDQRPEGVGQVTVRGEVQVRTEDQSQHGDIVT